MSSPAHDSHGKGGHGKKTNGPLGPILDFLNGIDHWAHHFHLNVPIFVALCATSYVVYSSQRPLGVIIFLVGVTWFFKEPIEHMFDTAKLEWDIDLVFPAMILAVFYYGLTAGLILAVMGTYFFKGRNPREANLTVIPRDFAARAFVAFSAYLVTDTSTLTSYGVFASIIYYVVIHVAVELPHGMLPLFEVTDLLFNLILALVLFLQIFPLIL